MRIVEIDLEGGAGDGKRLDTDLREAMRRRDFLDGGVRAAAEFRVVTVGERDVERKNIASDGSNRALDDDVRPGPVFGLAVAVGQVHAHEGDVGGGDTSVDADGVSGGEAGGAGDLNRACARRHVDVGSERSGLGGCGCFCGCGVFVVGGRCSGRADVQAEMRSFGEHEDRFADAGTAEHDVRGGDVDRLAEVEGSGSELQGEGFVLRSGACGGAVKRGLKGGGIVLAGGG